MNPCTYNKLIHQGGQINKNQVTLIRVGQTITVVRKDKRQDVCSQTQTWSLETQEVNLRRKKLNTMTQGIPQSET